MIKLFSKWYGSGKEAPEQTEDTGHVQPADCHDDEVVKKMADLIIDQYESDFDEKPPFPITEKTNFRQDLHFEKSDMGLLIMRLQEVFQVRLPKGSTFFDRPADDTDYTVGDLLAAYDLIQQEKPSEKEKKTPSSSDLLPLFVDMEEDPTAEEIVRVAGLADTILNLTFKNPFPIKEDPVFDAVRKAMTSSFMECLQSGKFTIEPHEELKQSYERKYPDFIVKSMMEIDYWNQRMMEHVVVTKTLGPKPAFQCLQAALNLSSFAGEPSAILIVNYAHLLLKCSMLKVQNPQAVEDITEVLHKASGFLNFDPGIKFSMS